MKSSLVIAGVIASAVWAAPVLADQVTAPDPLSNIVLTDAIRVEVVRSEVGHCATTVIEAFNLPEGSLNYDPRCTILRAATPFDSARNE